MYETFINIIFKINKYLDCVFDNLWIRIGCTTEDFVEVFNGSLPVSFQVGCHLEPGVILVFQDFLVAQLE